jgi:hypothetical protein
MIVIVAGSAMAQADSAVVQLSSSAYESFVGSMSGNGRFVVFESKGDLATENPRNADHNTEIFLYDYAQRRIFQITNTRSVLYDDKQTVESNPNIRIQITNSRPMISNDGRWIIFGSNATTSRPLAPNSTNPSLFDGNAFTSPTPTPVPTASPTPTPSPSPTPGGNPLSLDANMEMWLYQIPAYTSVADLSVGDEVPFADLAGGPFTPLTNTDPSQLPLPGTAINPPVVADDNHSASINDDGNAVAFVSNRDLVPAVGNAFPADDNDEIFTYLRSTVTLQQVTKQSRGTQPQTNPIYSKNPTISGNGLRVAFASTGDDPIDDPNSATNFDTGTNPAATRNEEIFYADLNGIGAPTGGKQITTTTPTTAGAPVNILDPGRRMSRDGRFIAFDSYADLGNASPGANSSAFALFVYDATTGLFRQVGPRSDGDSAATGGDVAHYPGFTDYNGSGIPQTLVLETRENIKADGTVAATEADGLNPATTRPSQIYSYTLGQPAASSTFTRLAKFPDPFLVLVSTQPVPSDSLKRMTFSIAESELGFGNVDGNAEVYYLVKPTVTSEVVPTNSLATGATRLPISATPTPTVSPTPTPSPTATPSPTPVTPPSVLGLGDGMLASLDYTATDTPITPRTGVGDIKRVPSLPIELSGVTLTIDGAACGLKSVGGRHIDFVVPPALPNTLDGSKTSPFVLVNNGVAMRSTVSIVPARPDIFRLDNVPAAGGRAKLFNVTNRVHTTEPFTARTVKIKGGVFVPTVLRMYLTGVDSLSPGIISIRIKDVTINGVLSTPTLIEPGVYTIDFPLPANINGEGESPVVVTVTINGVTFSSRLDDTTSFVRIL